MTKRTNKQIRRNTGLGSLLGLAFVALFTIAVAVPSSYASNESVDECVRGETSLCTEKSQIPREWNWKKADIKFDHMFRSDR